MRERPAYQSPFRFLIFNDALDQHLFTKTFILLYKNHSSSFLFSTEPAEIQVCKGGLDTAIFSTETLKILAPVCSGEFVTPDLPSHLFLGEPCGIVEAHTPKPTSWLQS